jgi:butyryl-CoA dehydrogenase
MTWQDGFVFDLSEDEKMVQETARSFAQNEVLPIAASLDGEHRFPKELIPQMGQLGFMGATFDSKYEGAELSYVSYALIIEELAAACASTSIICSAHNSLCLWPIAEYGTEEQKERFLKDLASGRKLGCFALSEPGTGSDAGALTCSVKQVGDKFIINGSKNWITNGPEADTCVLFTTIDTKLEHKGVVAFVHDLNLPGITRGKHEDKLGICASPTCGLSYTDVELTKDNLLGKVGDGFKIAMTTLNGGRIGVAAQALGIARASLEDALRYGKDRKTFGKALVEHQSIQNYLADMIIKIDSARYLTLAAAKLKDQGKSHIRQAAMAKLAASEAAMFCANYGIQIHGGYGYVKEYPAERHLRDAKITEIYEGTSEIQRLVIAQSLVKES